MSEPVSQITENEASINQDQSQDPNRIQGPGSILPTMYALAKNTPSDINEHLPVLLSLAHQCTSVVEIGVRSMVSTWALLHGMKEGSAYTGIDLVLPPRYSFNLAITAAHHKKVQFRFIDRNDMTISPGEIGPVDMIFIDSLHTYCHLTYELDRFSHLARKFLAFHDSSAPWGEIDDSEYRGDRSEYPVWYDRTKRGVWPAIVDFLSNHPEWAIKERRFNNHGFTVLERVDCGKKQSFLDRLPAPILPDTIE